MPRLVLAFVVFVSVIVCSSLSALSFQGTSPLDAAVKAASELPRLHSLLVSRRGELILERYFNGRRATTPANVKSYRRALSPSVGIASIENCSISNTPSDAIFRALSSAADERKRAVTIEDLLTMRSGSSPRAIETTVRGCRAETGSVTCWQSRS